MATGPALVLIAWKQGVVGQIRPGPYFDAIMKRSITRNWRNWADCIVDTRNAMAGIKTQARPSLEGLRSAACAPKKHWSAAACSCLYASFAQN